MANQWTLTGSHLLERIVSFFGAIPYVKSLAIFGSRYAAGATIIDAINTTRSYDPSHGVSSDGGTTSNPTGVKYTRVGPTKPMDSYNYTEVISVVKSLYKAGYKETALSFLLAHTTGASGTDLTLDGPYLLSTMESSINDFYTGYAYAFTTEEGSTAITVAGSIVSLMLTTDTDKLYGVITRHPVVTDYQGTIQPPLPYSAGGPARYQATPFFLTTILLEQPASVVPPTTIFEVFVSGAVSGDEYPASALLPDGTTVYGFVTYEEYEEGGETLYYYGFYGANGFYVEDESLSLTNNMFAEYLPSNAGSTSDVIGPGVADVTFRFTLALNRWTRIPKRGGRMWDLRPLLATPLGLDVERIARMSVVGDIENSYRLYIPNTVAGDEYYWIFGADIQVWAEGINIYGASKYEDRVYQYGYNPNPIGDYSYSRTYTTHDRIAYATSLKVTQGATVQDLVWASDYVYPEVEIFRFEYGTHITSIGPQEGVALYMQRHPSSVNWYTRRGTYVYTWNVADTLVEWHEPYPLYWTGVASWSITSPLLPAPLVTTSDPSTSGININDPGYIMGTFAFSEMAKGRVKVTRYQPTDPWVLGVQHTMTLYIDDVVVDTRIITPRRQWMADLVAYESEAKFPGYYPNLGGNPANGSPKSQNISKMDVVEYIADNGQGYSGNLIERRWWYTGYSFEGLPAPYITTMYPPGAVPAAGTGISTSILTIPPAYGGDTVLSQFSNYFTLLAIKVLPDLPPALPEEAPKPPKDGLAVIATSTYQAMSLSARLKMYVPRFEDLENTWTGNASPGYVKGIPANFTDYIGTAFAGYNAFLAAENTPGNGSSYVMTAEERVGLIDIAAVLDTLVAAFTAARASLINPAVPTATKQSLWAPIYAASQGQWGLYHTVVYNDFADASPGVSKVVAGAQPDARVTEPNLLVAMATLPYTSLAQQWPSVRGVVYLNVADLWPLYKDQTRTGSI